MVEQKKLREEIADIVARETFGGGLPIEVTPGERESCLIAADRILALVSPLMREAMEALEPFDKLNDEWDARLLAAGRAMKITLVKDFSGKWVPRVDGISLKDTSSGKPRSFTTQMRALGAAQAAVARLTNCDPAKIASMEEKP